MKRKIGLILVLGAALPLVAVSAAWACGVLASLRLDKGVAAPGQTVTATGTNYSSAADAPVILRLKSRSGQELARTNADASNRINTTFALPANLSPGWYVVLATQTLANGTTKSGTPGRTTLRVQGTKSSAAAPAGWGATPSGPAAGDGGSLLPIALAALLSLTMLASGWTLVGRARRSVTGPQFGV